MVKKHGFEASVVEQDVMVAVTMPLSYAFLIRDVFAGLTNYATREIVGRSYRKGALANLDRVEDGTYRIFDVFDDVTAAAVHDVFAEDE